MDFSTQARVGSDVAGAQLAEGGASPDDDPASDEAPPPPERPLSPGASAVEPPASVFPECEPACGEAPPLSWGEEGKSVVLPRFVERQPPLETTQAAPTTIAQNQDELPMKRRYLRGSGTGWRRGSKVESAFIQP
jgi:hypothetical protein